MHRLGCGIKTPHSDTLLFMNEVNNYLAGVQPDKRKELERIRAIVKAFVPDATESISYGMPTFKYDGKPLLYYAAFKNHLSIFPTPEPTEQLRDSLKSYKVSKGTIQFTLDKTLPKQIIEDILTIRLQAIRK